MTIRILKNIGTFVTIDSIIKIPNQMHYTLRVNPCSSLSTPHKSELSLWSSMVRFSLLLQSSLTKDVIERDPLKTGTTRGDQMFHAGSALAFPLSNSDDEDTEMQTVEKDDSDEDGNGNEDGNGSTDESEMREAVADTTTQEAHDAPSDEEIGKEDSDESQMRDAVADTTTQEAHDAPNDEEIGKEDSDETEMRDAVADTMVQDSTDDTNDEEIDDEDAV